MPQGGGSILPASADAAFRAIANQTCDNLRRVCKSRTRPPLAVGVDDRVFPDHKT